MNDETPDNSKALEVELPEGEQQIPLWRFTLVMAEVIFDCEMGIQTRRIQFVSKSDGETFPRTRLLQLQKLAASNVVAELKTQSKGAIKDITVEAVYLINFLDCGWMTEDEFLHSETALVATSEMAAEDNAAPLETPDNVVPLRPA